VNVAGEIACRFRQALVSCLQVTGDAGVGRLWLRSSRSGREADQHGGEQRGKRRPERSPARTEGRGEAREDTDHEVDHVSASVAIGAHSTTAGQPGDRKSGRDVRALASDVDLERLARTATGLSGADLSNLCNEAALGAACHNRAEVTMADLDQAWDKIVLGAERTTVLTPHDRRVVAYHESGHVVVAWLTPPADSVREGTIVPHGRSLGVTQQLPTEDHYDMSRTDLLARLDVMLGGRESEALVIGDITTGAEDDLVQATRLARRMITRWGMGSPGPVAFESDDEQPFLGYQLS
jgi:hypothetical protein